MRNDQWTPEEMAAFATVQREQPIGCTCGKPQETGPAFHDIGCEWRTRQAAAARAENLNEVEP